MTYLRPAAAALGLLLAVGACSTDPASSEPASDETLTVTSEFGEVEIPAEPQRALGMYTTDVDILITLGFPLADEQPIRGDGYTDFPDFFPQEQLEDVTPFANYPDYNYEAILAAQPDFILNGLGYDQKTVKRLAEIAPTYSVDAFDGQSWLVHFEETAEALDRVEERDAWTAAYEQRLGEVREAIGDDLDGIVVAPVSYWDGKVTSSCYSGVECTAFEDLGLTIFPGAKKKNGEGVALSSEQVGQLADVDYAFSTRMPGEKGEAEFEQLLADLGKNPLWADLGFVQADHIVSYDMEMTYGSPSGQMAFLDVVAEALGNG
jgi:iron complex transport system substrate-binding protein